MDAGKQPHLTAAELPPRQLGNAHEVLWHDLAELALWLELIEGTPALPDESEQLPPAEIERLAQDLAMDWRLGSEDAQHAAKALRRLALLDREHQGRTGTA